MAGSAKKFVFPRHYIVQVGVADPYSLNYRNYVAKYDNNSNVDVKSFIQMHTFSEPEYSQSESND